MRLRVTSANMMRHLSWRRSSGSYRSWYGTVIVFWLRSGQAFFS